MPLAGQESLATLYPEPQLGYKGERLWFHERLAIVAWKVLQLLGKITPRSESGT
jgi:hypothetical protein